MKTIAYKNGGDFIGEYEAQDLAKWKKMGLDLGQRFMYKGYRYYDRQKDIVIVYDIEPWKWSERMLRRGNGFLGIREYYL